jgi:hypothetical protein
MIRIWSGENGAQLQRVQITARVQDNAQNSGNCKSSGFRVQDSGFSEKDRQKKQRYKNRE